MNGHARFIIRDADDDLALHRATLRLGTVALPLASAQIDVTSTTIVVSTSSEHELIEVQDRVEAGASPLLLSHVPLPLIGNLDVTAWIADQSLKNVKLYGNVQLEGGSLVCGLTRLFPLIWPATTIVWDQNALEVHARVDGGIHRAPSGLGGAEATASFKAKEWLIKVCGDALLAPGADALDALDCLELSRSGLAL